MLTFKRTFPEYPLTPPHFSTFFHFKHWVTILEWNMKKIINKCVVVLRCVVSCRVVLYCIVLYCIVLYCIVLYCIVLYCIVLYCIVLYCIVFCFVLNCFVFFHFILIEIRFILFITEKDNRSNYWGVSYRFARLIKYHVHYNHPYH